MRTPFQWRITPISPTGAGVFCGIKETFRFLFESRKISVIVAREGVEPPPTGYESVHLPLIVPRYVAGISYPAGLLIRIAQGGFPVGRHRPSPFTGML